MSAAPNTLEVLRRFLAGEKVGRLQVMQAQDEVTQLLRHAPEETKTELVPIGNPKLSEHERLVYECQGLFMLFEKLLTELIQKKMLSAVNKDFMDRILAVKSHLRDAGFETHRMPGFPELIQAVTKGQGHA